MDAVTQKICVGCGKDVSTMKRVRDDVGRYFCQPCYTAQQERGSQAVIAAEGPASPSVFVTRAVPTPNAVITKPPKHQDARPVPPQTQSRTKVLVVISASVLLVISIIGTLIMLHRPTAISQSVKSPEHDDDVYEHPERLKDSNFSANQMRVSGVRLGDEQATVLSTKPGLEANQYGKLAIAPAVTAVLKDNNVRTIIVSNEDWIKRAGLKTYADASNILGKADAEQYSPADEMAVLISRKDGTPPPTSPSAGIIDYFYFKRGIEIDTVDGQTVNVNFTANPGTERLTSFVKSVEAFAAILEKQQSDLSVGMTLMDLRSNVQQMAAARKKFSLPPLAWNIAVDFQKNADEALQRYTSALRSWANGGTARDDWMQSGTDFTRKAQSDLQQMRAKLG